MNGGRGLLMLLRAIICAIVLLYGLTFCVAMALHNLQGLLDRVKEMETRMREDSSMSTR